MQFIDATIVINILSIPPIPDFTLHKPIINPYKCTIKMDSSRDLDKRITFIERKVLLAQDRIIKQRDAANAIFKELSRQSKSLEDMKKEWIKKSNIERERVKTEKNEISQSFRLILNDLIAKYEEERQNKLRELKVSIIEEEREIKELQRARDEEVMKTKAEETQIKSRYQVKINALLREEQAALRTGVIRQKRLLEAPNIYSMAVEKSNPVGMKKRAYNPTRPF